MCLFCCCCRDAGSGIGRISWGRSVPPQLEKKGGRIAFVLNFSIDLRYHISFNIFPWEFFLLVCALDAVLYRY